MTRASQLQHLRRRPKRPQARPLIVLLWSKPARILLQQRKAEARKRGRLTKLCRRKTSRLQLIRSLLKQRKPRRSRRRAEASPPMRSRIRQMSKPTPRSFPRHNLRSAQRERRRALLELSNGRLFHLWKSDYRTGPTLSHIGPKLHTRNMPVRWSKVVVTRSWPKPPITVPLRKCAFASAPMRKAKHDANTAMLILAIWNDVRGGRALSSFYAVASFFTSASPFVTCANPVLLFCPKVMAQSQPQYVSLSRAGFPAQIEASRD